MIFAGATKQIWGVSASVAEAARQRSRTTPTLLRDLKTLVEPATRGDPMKSLLWTSRSLRKLSKELANKGHEVSHTVVGELLQQAGYSCRRTAKPAKATSIWIETRNFSTSMRAPFARAMAWDTSSSISFAVMIFML